MRRIDFYRFLRIEIVTSKSIPKASLGFFAMIKIIEANWLALGRGRQNTKWQTLICELN